KLTIRVCQTSESPSLKLVLAVVLLVVAAIVLMSLQLTQINQQRQYSRNKLPMAVSQSKRQIKKTKRIIKTKALRYEKRRKNLALILKMSKAVVAVVV